MSPFALVQICCLVAFALLLVAAGWQDLRTMRIGNGLSLAVLGTFALWAATGLVSDKIPLGQVGLSIACAAAVFAVGVLAFAAGVLGGGDVKLLAAASLFAGPARQFDFLTITALVGGAMGLAILAGAPIGPSVGGTVRLRSGLPYGPAIAAGGLWVAASLAVV